MGFKSIGHKEYWALGVMGVIHGQQSKRERWVFDQDSLKSGFLATTSEKGQNISIDSNIDESEGVTLPPANDTTGRLIAQHLQQSPLLQATHPQ